MEEIKEKSAKKPVSMRLTATASDTADAHH